MKVFISCPFGYGSTLAKELKLLGYKTYDTYEKWTYLDWDRNTVYKINLRSRVANKVYVILDEKRCNDFDTYFDMINEINRKDYINIWQGIHIKATAKTSKLNSERTLQGLALKSIIKKLMVGTWEEQRAIDKHRPKAQVEVYWDKDRFRISLNTSGFALHERWYRSKTWKAPLKENIAAGLILQSAWKFSKPLRDPFCWSGTVAIEAAMIARNIAPGLLRRFSFEQMPIFKTEDLAKLKEEAREKQYDKHYKIIASDIDERMTNIAKWNAKNAWVWDTITFITQDFTDKEFPETAEHPIHIVTNPPYGKRLDDDQEKVKWIFKTLIELWESGKYSGGFLSLDNVGKHNKKVRKQKPVYNWADRCEFWRITLD